MITKPSVGAAQQDAFEALAGEVYEPIQRYLRRRCAPADVDEVLNDVLLTLWRRVDDIPSDRTLPWAYGIARRCLANRRRGNTRQLRLVERLGRDTTRDAPTMEWTSSTDVALQAAVDGLPELDQEVIRLWAWERLEPREIADVLETTANAVSVRLHRIQRRLAEEIERKDVAPAGHRRDEDHEEVER